MNFKKYIYNVIQPAEKGSIISKIFDLFIMALILFSVASVFIMTFPVSDKTIRIMSRIEEWSLVIFTVEYVLRIWTADYLFPNDGKIKSRLKYMVSGMAIIDLIAILPFFLPMLLPVNLVGIRAFRLIRLLRIFKLNRYSAALASIVEVFRKKAQEILVSIFFLL
jgi:voltage-gated potassium channel